MSEENRREFLKTMLSAGAVLGLSLSPFKSFAKEKYTKLTILHTNDVHSQIEPFPLNDPKYPGLGGCARRAKLINKIRMQEKNVLLFDAGDSFQGTPYFNYFKGELEFKLMSKMGYNASTIGNHEFDFGIENIALQLKNVNFPLIISNYDLKNTALNGKTLTHKIYQVDGLKIGVFGLGIELEGLVNPQLYKKTVYLEPLKKADEMSYLLKKKYNCDIIICISHLGYSYKENNIVSDIKIAESTKYIDLIIGGHTHTFLDKAVRVKNYYNKETIIVQAGWAGIVLGRLDFYILKKTRFKFVDSTHIKIKNNLN